jgi:hypothetical protein
MGNFSQQPEFATSGSNHTLDTANFTTNLNGQAVYIQSDTELNVIFAGDVPSYENVVQFKGLKGGSFLPLVADYIVPVAIATPKFLGTGTDIQADFASAVTGAVAGTYTVDCDVLANGSAKDGEVRLKIIVDASRNITTAEVVNPSSNNATLSTSSKVTIPANTLGDTSSAVTSDVLEGGDLTTSALTIAAPTGAIVTFS